MNNRHPYRQQVLFTARDNGDQCRMCVCVRSIAFKPIGQWLLLCVLSVGFSFSAAHGDDSAGKAMALRRIFGQSISADNVRAIRLRATAMPVAERFVSVEGSDAEFKLLAADGVSANFSWNPEGRHILMSRAGLLHEYDIETDKIAPIPGHSADQAKDGAVWDPTGRLIVFIGVGKPQSVEWK